jgi:hypothetical protein
VSLKSWIPAAEGLPALEPSYGTTESQRLLLEVAVPWRVPRPSGWRGNTLSPK